MKRSALVASFMFATLVLAACMPDVVYTPTENLKFRDSAFRECVVSEARKNGWADAGHVLRLHCVNPESRKSSDLGGIRNLVNIRELDLAHNAIRDIEPLVALTKLERLVLDDNEISSIPDGISRISITHLSLNHNQVRDVSPIGYLRHLEMLSLASNELTDVAALQSNASVQALNLSQNRIADIRMLGLLQNLRELDVTSNQVSDLSGLATLSQLEHLYLADNRLRDVSALAQLLNLREIDLANNQLVSNDIQIICFTFISQFS